MTKDILLNTSIIKTIRFNAYYFGLSSIIHPYVLVSRNVKFKLLKGNIEIKKKHLGGIKLGYGYVGIVDNKYERTLWENTGSVIFDGNASIGTGTRIANAGKLQIGENCSINCSSSIICNNNIRIGANALVSWDVLIMDTDLHSIYSMDGTCLNDDKPVLIGDEVWIGCRVLVLKGSTIANKCVIAAGSVVSKHLESESCIFVNNVKISENIVWKK